MTGDHDFYKRASLRALLLAASLTLGLAASAQAWTVSPADIQLTGKPGLITRGSFEVISADSVGRHFRVVAQNLGETPTGAFTFTNAEHSAANWVEILPSDFLGSKRAQSVDYAIAIPSNATPGDHVAAISIQELPEGTQGNIGVVEAVGIRLVIHVPGTVYPAAKITRFDAPRLTFGDGVAIHATVVNTGDTVLDFNGANRGSAITIAKQSYPLVGLLLPGAKRGAQLCLERSAAAGFDDRSPACHDARTSLSQCLHLDLCLPALPAAWCDPAGTSGLCLSASA